MEFNRKELLASTAQQYHDRYAAEIAFRLRKGNHLSVLLPSMLPAYPLILNIYEVLDFREREYVIVDSQDEVEFISDLLMHSGRENDCIYPMTYEQFLEYSFTSGCLVMLNLDQEKRIILSKMLSSMKGQKVISIGNLDKNESVDINGSFYDLHSNKILDELFQMTLSDSDPHAMVFYVDSVLDVRDIMFASPTEKVQITKQISDVAADYERDCEKAGMGISSKHNVEILKEQYTAVDELSAQLGLMKTMVLSAGMQVEDLEEGLKQVRELKRTYAPMIENELDPEKKEILISEFEGKITDISVSLTQSVLTHQNQNSYEKRIVYMLSESVWNKLSELSKKYLVSACMTYDALAQMKDDSIDFSGVCLQITKTLDVELASRFYQKYKRYLERKYPVHTSLGRWPNAMKTRDGLAPLEEKDFTLGTISYVLGVKGDGTVANNYSFREVTNYAREYIYKLGISRSGIEQKLKNIAIYTEKVRSDYRNPSAHRSAITYVTATECMEYLIEHYKKLKEILEDMKA